MIFNNDYSGLFNTFATMIGVGILFFILSLVVHRKRAKWNKFFAFETLLGMIIGALVGALIFGVIKI